MEMEAWIESWRPSASEKLLGDARSMTLTADAVRALAWYKKISIPKEMLDRIDSKIVNKKIGDFTLVKKMPQDILACIPEDMRNIQEWTLKAG